MARRKRRRSSTLRDWEPTCQLRLTIGGSVQDGKCRSRNVASFLAIVRRETFKAFPNGNTLVRASGRWRCERDGGKLTRPVSEPSIVVDVSDADCRALASSGEQLGRRLARLLRQDSTMLHLTSSSGATCRAFVTKDGKQEPVHPDCRRVLKVA